jgi:hypothetical protein
MFRKMKLAKPTDPPGSPMEPPRLPAQERRRFVFTFGQMKVVTVMDLVKIGLLWFLTGALIAGAVMVQLQWPEPAPPAPAKRAPRAPVIEKSTAAETVAKVQTPQGECTLVIDHKRQTWSLSC